MVHRSSEQSSANAMEEGGARQKGRTSNHVTSQRKRGLPIFLGQRNLHVRSKHGGDGR